MDNEYRSAIIEMLKNQEQKYIKSAMRDRSEAIQYEQCGMSPLSEELHSLADKHETQADYTKILIELVQNA